jgi:hypothetical protein
MWNEEKSDSRRRGKKLSVTGDGAKLNKHVLSHLLYVAV